MNLGRVTRLFLLAAGALICVASALAGQKAEENKQRAKARYYFLKGAESEAREELDKAHEFYRKAYVSDPSYPEAAFAYGSSRLMIPIDTFSSPVEIARNLRLMRSLVDAYPGDIEAAERYAYVAAAADTFPEAIRIYKKLVAAHPGLSRLYGPLAYYHFNMGHADSAVYAIREFERLEGATTETTIRKVSYWLTKEDTVSALREVARYADENPGIPEPIIDKGMIYGLLGQQDSAIMFLEDAIRQFPDQSNMKFNIAMLYAEKGDTARFHSLTEEAFKGEDMEYEDRMHILTAYTKALPAGAEDYTESDRLYAYAAALYPEDADFFDQYAQYQVTKGDFNEALAKEKRALAISPSEPSFLGRAMSLAIVADKPAESLRLFEAFPDTASRNQYGIILTYISAAQLAEEYAKGLQWADSIVVRALPDFSLKSEISEAQADSLRSAAAGYQLFQASTAYEVAADIYARMKRSDDAVRNYQNSISLMPDDNASALNNYAYYIVETLKAAPGSELFEKAKEMSHKALEQSADAPQGNYYDTFAWILFKEQNYKDALTYQEMAIEEEGDGEIAAEMLEHYGDILFMNGRPEEAVEQWEKAFAADPDNAVLKKKVEHKTYFYE